MAQKLSPYFISLVYDALLKSFWRRTTLIDFLRRHNISETLLATMQEGESKRTFLTRTFPLIEKHPQSADIIQSLAATLAEQDKFPDLDGWENSVQMKQDATEAVDTLRKCLNLRKDKLAEERLREELQQEGQKKLAESISKRDSLDELKQRLIDLSTELGTSSGGYKFENWFYDLVAFFEIIARRPYKIHGRQIDGSITVEGTTYLIELKYSKSPSVPEHVDSLFSKVNDKADNTMGILVSMSGFTDIAIQQASGRKTPLLLMDYGHIYLALGGIWSLSETITRLRRYASQTGQAYLSSTDFLK